MHLDGFFEQQGKLGFVGNFIWSLKYGCLLQNEVYSLKSLKMDQIKDFNFNCTWTAMTESLSCKLTLKAFFTQFCQKNSLRVKVKLLRVENVVWKSDVKSRQLYRCCLPSLSINCQLLIICEQQSRASKCFQKFWVGIR